MDIQKIRRNAATLGLISIAMAGLPAQAAEVDCTALNPWQSGQTYLKGDQVKASEQAFEAKWWSQSNPVDNAGPWDAWKKLGDCASGTPDNIPPTAGWISPANNASFSKNDSVVIEVDAKDEDGQVARVDLYLGETLLATSTNSPYRVNWTAVAGQHVLTAVVVDDKGAKVDASPVSITVSEGPVNQAPTASLQVISAPSPVKVGDTVVFALSGSDSDGQVTSLELFENGASVFSNTGADASYSWQASQAGAVEFTLEAKDDNNASGQSGVITLNVQAGGDPGNGRDDCKPAGLYQTPGVNTPYCSIYDSDGREKMAADHPRRVIGYFTSWRNGGNGQPAYLVKDIPWDKITHINYAFAHVDVNNKISVGDPGSVGNPATNMEWPGVVGAEMDPAYAYKGHFNLLNKYKKQYPDVKTLISVGGWAETGGYIGDNGRVASGGFYTMTTNSDGSVNQAGIDAFTASVVDFIRQYGFDGVDIDYEYPTSMDDAGHPGDFAISNARRAGLNNSYQVLMKSLRQALDIAGQASGKHYMLTIASPSSGYLLRGMETFQTVKYLDYVNIMSYDLHGAWNSHVGHNAALFDTGEDSELKVWDVYTTKEFEGIGYLNTDWAVRYFRGGLSAGRINIGVPYYSRGFKDVVGGSQGLWGQAKFPDQANCHDGTGKGDKNFCGNGAIGIDNLWHDIENDREVPAGSNPLWHLKNLENGITPSYLAAYGLTPDTDPDDRFTGSYVRHYDAVAVAPWLWNAQKSVFLSSEDEESMATKLDYIISNELGGIMFWELAGDFAFDSAKGEYFMGSTMTSLAYDKFKLSGTAYGTQMGDGNFVVPAEMVDVGFAAKDFPLGDDNYPISPTFSFTNNSQIDFTGATIAFDVPVSTSAIFKSKWNATKKLKLEVISNGSNAAGNNIGGFDNEFHRFAITLTNEWGGVDEAFAPGQTLDAQVMYYLPMSGPVNFTISKNGKSYAFKSEYPDLPEATDGSGGNTCGDVVDGVSTDIIPVYPNWPQGDHAAGGDMVIHDNTVYRAKWWTNSVPGGADWDLVCSL